MPSKHKPKLGQNFLVAPQARQAIVSALGDTTARTVLEIGPGHGALTDLLVPRCGRLFLVEFDASLAAELRFRYRSSTHVEVVQADFLQLDLSKMLPAAETSDIIGNLPYYITSDILLKLFAESRSGLLGRAVLMTQREVADRVAAHPGVRDYGLLSATAQLHARVEKLFTLSPAAFSPPPDVHSTVLRFDFASRFEEFEIDPASFDLFLHQIFAQKRKTLRNNLRSAGHELRHIAEAWPPEIPTEARAESLSLEETARLYRRLNKALGLVQPPLAS